ncbi:MAG TPA: ImmA/IrrE family metallo-endopeptidase [Iamia sp.]
MDLGTSAAARRLWREARSRPNLEVVVTDLPAGMRALHAVDEDGFRCILISAALTPAEKLAALAHELAHDDCEGGCHHPGLPDRLRAVVARDEARVDRVAADRILPLAWLASWVDRQVAADRPVTAAGAAEELDVADWVAELQLRRLEARNRGAA